MCSAVYDAGSVESRGLYTRSGQLAAVLGFGARELFKAQSP